MIMFYIDKQNDDTASNMNLVKGDEITIDTIKENGVEVTIKKIQDAEDTSTYTRSMDEKMRCRTVLLGRLN